MKIGVMQPYFLPYIGYFQLIDAVDKFIILDDVNYIKKGYINRNVMLLNGMEHKFTLPLEKASQNKLISEIDVTKNPKELSKQLRMFEMAYAKAPYFKTVYPLLEKIYSFKELNLSKFIVYSIKVICRYLEISTDIVESSGEFEKKELHGEERIVDLVKINQGTTYINAIGGKRLYNPISFEQNEIELYFIEQGSWSYKQFSNEFIPFLSIVDVLMFNSKHETQHLITNYNLVK